MKTTFFILSSLLIFSSIATKTEFKKQLDKLETTKFGKTLLQTIFMQVQTDEPLANLIEMIQNLENQVEAEQRRDDEKLQKVLASCNADFDSLQSAIGLATSSSLGLKSELDQLNPQHSAAMANLDRKISEINDLQNELNDQTTRRETENHSFLQIIDDLESAIFGISTVKTYFNNYLDKLEKDRRKFDKQAPEESFLQKNHRTYEYNEDDFDSSSDERRTPMSLAQISSKINKIKHQVKLEGYRAMVQILGQLASTMNQVSDEASDAEILTKKTLVILKQIEAFIQSQRVSEEQAEEARAVAFDELKELYTTQIVEASSERVALEGSAELLGNRITSASNEKFECDQKIQVKQRERNDREAECLSSQQEYDTETAKRNNEKVAITLALDLISSKLGQIKKQILENGGDDEE